MMLKFFEFHDLISIDYELATMIYACKINYIIFNNGINFNISLLPLQYIQHAIDSIVFSVIYSNV